MTCRRLLLVTVVLLIAACGRRIAVQAANAPTTSASNPTTQPASQPVATLTIEIKDLRNAKGQLIFGVFKSADGFPNESGKSVYWEVRDLKGAKRPIVFTATLPPGVYGASVLHDENKSGDMEKGLGGIPKEGYGVTNNPKPRFRAAKYSEATFGLPEEGTTRTISVQYF
jgi:uncharacterized protein (DUF2141 family)